MSHLFSELGELNCIKYGGDIRQSSALSTYVVVFLYVALFRNEGDSHANLVEKSKSVLWAGNQSGWRLHV